MSSKSVVVLILVLLACVAAGLVFRTSTDRDEPAPGEASSPLDGSERGVVTVEPAPVEEDLAMDAGEWHEFRDHAYRLTPQPLDWHGAEAAAQELGGHLVAIESEEENTWLIETFGGDSLFWIGLTDEEVEGEYRWTSGARLGEYSSWHPGEPNDQYGREDYVFTNFFQPGRWNDLGPGSPRWGFYYGIVEVSGEN